MASAQPMAVEAPTLANPETVATHVPKVNASGAASGSASDAPNGTRRRADDDSSDDDAPLSKKPRASASGPKQKKRRVVESDDESDSGPSSPAQVKGEPQPTPKANGKTSKRAPPSYSDSNSDDDSDDKPLASKANGQKASNGHQHRRGSSSEPLAKKKPASKPRSSAADRNKVEPKKEVKSDSEDDEPLVKTVSNKSASKVKENKPVVKKEKKVKQEEEDEDKYKWWEQQAEGDGSVKWTSLEHNAVLFPPAYVPLPSGVKMKYDGVSLTLPPESEEVAGFFAAMLTTDHAQDAVFRQNFFRDFKDIVERHPPKENVKITSLEKCDFTPMYEYFEQEKEKKKALSKEEKKAIKEAKDELEKPYVHATIDGRKEKTGNFRAEPPGLFRGRGDHPRKGTLKHRLRPEDIIINIGKDAPVPKPNIPGQWKGVQHDNTVTWLAHWKENVNGQAKYVFLAAGSSWKGQSDRAKFEKARELIKHVDAIRKNYTAELKSKITADRQRATALYFIDRLALRAGNEKGEDEADTPPNKVIFDFLGKDSMRFHQEVEVDAQVFKNIKIFKAEPKTKGDDLFDRLTTTGLNKYLNDQMKGLTAKVFRTYNASWTFQQQLKNTPKNGTVQEKIAAYNTANREVAILCNHQKTVSKGFAESFAKMGDKVRALKYQRMKLRYQLFTLDPKYKKKRPDLAEDESDVDDEFIERHEDDLLQKALLAAEKKWERENVKAEEGKEEKKPRSVLEERKKEIKAEFKALAKERKTKHVEPKKGATEEKLVEQIAKMDDRIAAARVQMSDRDKTKDVALGTSKINYIDPRITVAWAAKYNVPLEKLFSKTLREKFPWAEAEADKDWVF